MLVLVVIYVIHYNEKFPLILAFEKLQGTFILCDFP
jgi:hypothetical protein